MFLQGQDVEDKLVRAGQTHDAAMPEAQFAALGLRQANLNLGIYGGATTDALGRMLQALDAVLYESGPDAVLVDGAATSTLTGVLLGRL